MGGIGQISNEYVLYGLARHEEVIRRIICEIGAKSEEFDIRLMLTEALTNAFHHGNGGSSEIPIHIKYSCKGGRVEFSVRDSGKGIDKVVIPDSISDSNLLGESGRGLFLISCIADEVEIREGRFIMRKTLACREKDTGT